GRGRAAACRGRGGNCGRHRHAAMRRGTEWFVALCYVQRNEAGERRVGAVRELDRTDVALGARLAADGPGIDAQTSGKQGVPLVEGLERLAPQAVWTRPATGRELAAVTRGRVLGAGWRRRWRQHRGLTDRVVTRERIALRPLLADEAGIVAVLVHATNRPAALRPSRHIHAPTARLDRRAVREHLVRPARHTLRADAVAEGMPGAPHARNRGWQPGEAGIDQRRQGPRRARAGSPAIRLRDHVAELLLDLLHAGHVVGGPGARGLARTYALAGGLPARRPELPRDTRRSPGNRPVERRHARRDCRMRSRRITRTRARPLRLGEPLGQLLLDLEATRRIDPAARVACVGLTDRSRLH